MFAGIIEWSMASGYSEIITVTDLRFERILKRAGWPMRRSGEPAPIGNTIATAGSLPADRQLRAGMPSGLWVAPPVQRSNAQERCVAQLRSHSRLGPKLQDALLATNCTSPSMMRP